MDPLLRLIQAHVLLSTVIDMWELLTKSANTVDC